MNKRLKQLRKSLNLSQEEMGSRLGVTGTALSRLESGDRNVTDMMLLAICREFGASEQWLRTGEGSMLVQTNSNVAHALAQEYHLGLYGEQLLAVYLALPEADKRAVERFVSKLTESVQKAENGLTETDAPPAQKEEEASSSSVG